MSASTLPASLPRATPAAAPRVRDARVVIGLLLALVVFAGGLAYWTFLAGPRTVVVVQRDLPAGALLTERDLGLTRVRVDGALAAQLFAAEDLPALVGRTTSEPLHVGELLLSARLSQRPLPAPGFVLAAVPLKPESGPGASARPGSHVRVLATVGKTGNSEASTTVVVPGAVVAEVVYAPRSSLLAGGEGRPSHAGEPVVLRVLVTEDEAVALARAKATATLDVVLLARPGGQEGGGRP